MPPDPSRSTLGPPRPINDPPVNPMGTGLIYESTDWEASSLHNSSQA